MSVPTLDLRREDFPDMAGDRIDRLLRALNRFSVDVAAQFDKGLTVSVQELEVTSAFPKTLRNPLTVRPQAVWIGKAVKVTNGKDEPVSLGNVAWTLNQRNEIELSAIDNVLSNERYRVKLIVAAG